MKILSRWAFNYKTIPRKSIRVISASLPTVSKNKHISCHFKKNKNVQVNATEFNAGSSSRNYFVSFVSGFGAVRSVPINVPHLNNEFAIYILLKNYIKRIKHLQ